MSDLVRGLLAAGLVFSAALAGMLLQRRLPRHHISKDTLDVVKLGAGLLSVLTSLVFGLLIATAKSASDTANREMRSFATDTIHLDRMLRSYGREADSPRALLVQAGRQTVQDLWPNDWRNAAGLDNPVTGRLLERMVREIIALPALEADRAWYREEALRTSLSLLRKRWQMIEETGPAVSAVVLSIVLFWTMLIFFNFGLNAPRNATVLSAFFLVSLAIGSAVFLVLEMDNQFDGVLGVSSQPMKRAMAELATGPD